MSKDNRRFKTEEDLIEFFRNAYGQFKTPVTEKRGDDGVIIDTKLRRDVLTGENTGMITINGRVRHFNFLNLTGGVWRCTVL